MTVWPFPFSATVSDTHTFAFAVHVKAMRVVYQAAAEFNLHDTVGIELHDRIERRAAAVERGAAVERPEALAIWIDLDADGGPPGAAGWQLRPVLLKLVRIGIGIGIVALRVCLLWR